MGIILDDGHYVSKLKEKKNDLVCFFFRLSDVLRGMCVPLEAQGPGIVKKSEKISGEKSADHSKGSETPPLDNQDGIWKVGSKFNAPSTVLLI